MGYGNKEVNRAKTLTPHAREISSRYFGPVALRFDQGCEGYHVVILFPFAFY